MLVDNAELQDLAKKPLMLSVMTLALQDNESLDYRLKNYAYSVEQIYKNNVGNCDIILIVLITILV